MRHSIIDIIEDIIKVFIPSLNNLIKEIGGINAYLLILIFTFFSILLAKVILKICNRSTKEYKNLIAFICLGTIETIILKLFKFDLMNNYFNFFISLLINVILFIILKIIINKQKNTIK